MNAPTFSVERATMGRNFWPSGSRVLAEKNSVTEVSPPDRMCLASCR